VEYGLESITKLRSPDGKKVDVLESNYTSPVSSIAMFHSSIVMNLISADHIISLYPKLSLEKHAMLQRDAAQRNQAWMSRYIDRGFTVWSSPFVGVHHQQWVADFCPARARRMGDCGTMIIPHGSCSYEKNMEAEEEVVCWKWMDDDPAHLECLDNQCLVEALD